MRYNNMKLRLGRRRRRRNFIVRRRTIVPYGKELHQAGVK